MLGVNSPLRSLRLHTPNIHLGKQARLGLSSQLVLRPKRSTHFTLTPEVFFLRRAYFYRNPRFSRDGNSRQLHN
jgi:hypothetical protein